MNANSHTDHGAKQALHVCVFCGSSPGNDPAYLAAAGELGRLIGEAGWTLVYGGGALGLMGEVSRAAAAAGAPIIGIRPKSLSHVELPREAGLTIEIVADLYERKKRMIELSDAFITLPGGLGTLDEFLEVVTTAQLCLHEKPSVLIDTSGFYAPLLSAFAAAHEAGFVYGQLERLYSVAATAAEAMAMIGALTAPSAPRP